MSKLFRLIANDSITFLPDEEIGLRVYLHKELLHTIHNDLILELTDTKLTDIILTSLKKHNEHKETKPPHNENITGE